MKNLSLLSLAIIVVSLFFSCRTDEFTEVVSEPIPIGGEPTTIVESHLNGVVLDEVKKPIENAQVYVSGEMTETDENGVFRFRNVDLSSEGSLIKISKDGFFDGFQFAIGLAGEYSHMEATLVKKVDQNFQSAIGGTIGVNGGGSITFSSNSITYADGSYYEGEVNIAAHWYNPSSDELIYTMPGDLRGIDENNETVQLLTYGMMAVELLSSSGEELQLAPNRIATMMFPIPNDSDVEKYATIPTWHLDENTGVWIEEGEAFVEGNFLVAKVFHFSFWNCDVPFPLVNITGRLVSEDGSPLPYQSIVIRDNKNDICQSGYTNESGVFSGKVPEGVDLSMFHFVCNENISIAELGSLTEDKDLGAISVAVDNTILLSGDLVDCDMESITNGYVKITTPSETKIISTDGNGELSYTLFHCNESEVTLLAYDYNSTKVSEPIMIDTDLVELDLETIPICEDIVGEYIRYFINDETHGVPLEKISVFVADNRMIYIFAYHDYDPNLAGPSSLLIKYDMTNKVGQYYAVGYTANGEWLETEGEDLDIQVSEVDGVGNLISMIFDNGEFRGDLSVVIDRVVDSGEVRGNVWLDEDEDGIRDPDEMPLAGKEISITYVWDPNDDFLDISSSYYPHPVNQKYSVVSDSDGNFAFTGIFVEYNLRLTYFEDPDVVLTKENVGNDDSIDSDFYARFIVSVNNRVQYNTDDFILENGGEKIDFGLGIKQ